MRQTGQLQVGQGRGHLAGDLKDRHCWHPAMTNEVLCGGHPARERLHNPDQSPPAPDAADRRQGEGVEPSARCRQRIKRSGKTLRCRLIVRFDQREVHGLRGLDVPGDVRPQIAGARLPSQQDVGPQPQRRAAPRMDLGSLVRSQESALEKRVDPDRLELRQAASQTPQPRPYPARLQRVGQPKPFE